MQGWSDIPLNETGRKQALCASTQLKRLPVSRLFTSDLSRAKETAEILNAVFQKPIETSACLREFCYGDYEGVDSQELWKNFDGLRRELCDTKNKNRNNLALPGAETCVQVMERVIGYLSDICQKHAEDHFMIVSHGGVIYNLTVLFASKPIPVENCDCLACCFDSEAKSFSNFKVIPAATALQKTHLKETNDR